MGRAYLFECSKCGYRAKVSGGADSGLHFAVQTISCADCKELHDAVTDLKVPVTPPVGRWKLKAARLDSPKIPSTPPKFQAVLNRLPLKTAGRFRWIHFKLVCPVAAFHRVKEWRHPGHCPRCGVFLECNAIPFRRWD